MSKHAEYRLIYSPARARAGRAAWVLTIPSELSSDGKRKQKAFAEEAQARAELKHLQAAQRELGTRARSMPHDTAQLAALALAMDTLPEGVSLQNAAAFAATCVAEFGNLSTALQLARWAHLRAACWPDVTVKQCMDELTATPLRSATSNHGRLWAMRHIYNADPLWCENTYLHQLTAPAIASQLERCANTAPVFNALRSQFSRVCSFAVEKGYAENNPVLKTRPKPHTEAEKICIPPHELQAMLAAAQPTEQLYIAVLAFAGVRPFEARRLTWGDVDLDDGYLSVRRRTSKTGGARHVELHPTLRAWLLHHRPANVSPTTRLAPATVRKLRALHKLCKDWQPDILRHSYASYSLKAGMPLETLQANMGHSTLALLRARYLNMSGLTRQLAAEWWSLTPDRVLTN